MGSINEIVLFETDDKEVTLSVPMDGDIVWLTQEQMSSLFATARSSIAYHIGNIFKEGELGKDTSVEIFDRSTNNASRPPKYNNLDVIISVGYGDAGYWMQLHDEMRSAGFRVMLTKDFSQHYAIIDDKVVWYGSINFLSKEDVGDNLIREADPLAVEDLKSLTFSETMDIEKL